MYYIAPFSQLVLLLLLLLLLLLFLLLIQTWKGNMGAAGKISVTSSRSDYTRVTFKPDLSKFKMTHLDKDIVSLMTRRAYDIAGGTKGVSVYLNGEKLEVS